MKTQCLLVWKWIMRCEELDLPLLSFELCCSYSVAHLSSGNIGCFCCLRQFLFFTSLLAFCLAFSQNGQVSSVLVILFAFQLKICLFSSSERLLCSFQQVFWPSFCCYSKLLPRISFALPFNTFLERRLHVFCFRKQTMIRLAKLQPTHNRH